MCTKFITSEFISETHAEKRPFGEIVLGLHFPDDLGCESRVLRTRTLHEVWDAELAWFGTKKVHGSAPWQYTAQTALEKSTRRPKMHMPPVRLRGLSPAPFSGILSPTSALVLTKMKLRLAAPPSTPAGAYTNHMSLIATPVSSSTGQRKFFTDQSGVIRQTTDGSTPSSTSTPIGGE